MRYLSLFFIAMLLLPLGASAQWQKINDIDYVWGPFTIYNLSLFSETGEYRVDTRPVMLTLKYMKPVDGRDFAISLARSWSNLGITLPDQDIVVDRLRKIMPNIKKGDLLSYIALEDKGYFILNDMVIDEEFNQDFNNAVVAVWLDPRVEIGKALLSKQKKMLEMPKPSIAIPAEREQIEPQNIATVEKTISVEPEKKEEGSLQAVSLPENSANLEKNNQPVIEEKQVGQQPKQHIEQKTETQNSTEKIENTQPVMLQEDKKPEPKMEQNEQNQSQEKEDQSIEILLPSDPVLLKEQPLG